MAESTLGNSNRPKSERVAVIAAIHHGGKAPWWVAVLIAAKEWGMPPWEVAQTGSRLLWFNRWAFWVGQLGKAVNQVSNG